MSEVQEFVAGLLNCLKTQKSAYGDTIRKDYVFSTEVENSLIDGIKEYTAIFTGS